MKHTDEEFRQEAQRQHGAIKVDFRESTVSRDESSESGAFVEARVRVWVEFDDEGDWVR